MPKTKRRPSSKAVGFSDDKPEKEPVMKSLRPRMVRKHSRGRARIVLVAGIIMIAMLSVMFFSSNELAADNVGDWLSNTFTGGTGTGFPVSIAGASVKNSNIAWDGSQLTVLSDTAYTTYSSNGKATIQRPHSYSTPLLTVSEKYSLIYNLGGNDFVLQSRSATIREGKTEDQIYAADVSHSGLYAIATTKSGYFSNTTVYSRNGEKLFSVDSSKYSVTDIDISPDETEAALLGVTTDGGQVQSAVYIYRFDSEQPQIYEYADTLLFEMNYMGQNEIAVMGEDFAGVIRKKTADTLQYDFGGGRLTGWSINPEGGISLALSEYLVSDSTKIIYLNREADEVYAFTVQGRVLSVDNDKTRTAVLTEGKLLCYAERGGLIYEADRDPADLFLRFQKSSVFVVGSVQISRVVV